MSHTVRRTWHYGSQYSVEGFEGETLEIALNGAMEGIDIPDHHYGAALDTISRGETYDEWSWYRFSGEK